MPTETCPGSRHPSWPPPSQGLGDLGTSALPRQGPQLSPRQPDPSPSDRRAALHHPCVPARCCQPRGGATRGISHTKPWAALFRLVQARERRNVLGTVTCSQCCLSRAPATSTPKANYPKYVLFVVNTEIFREIRQDTALAQEMMQGGPGFGWDR